MRRLPIYFLIDVSESMIGHPIQQVQNGMRQIVRELQQDPYALETAYISVIVFAGRAKMMMPLTETSRFYAPEFPLGSGTNLSEGLEMLMNDIDRSVSKTTAEHKGDWKPIIFLFTDGTPTNDCTNAINKWNSRYRQHCNMVAISIGDNADTKTLGQMTETVMRLNDTAEQSFREFFKWVTASIQTSSEAVCENKEAMKLAPIGNLDLEKVESSRQSRPDDNNVVIEAKCSSTKSLYLIKYAKRLRESQEFGGLGMKVRDFKLEGAYPVLHEDQYKELSDNNNNSNSINTSNLIGAPNCPCCGSSEAFNMCGNCNKIFCLDIESNKVICPWCQSELRFSGEGYSDFDVNRNLG